MKYRPARTCAPVLFLCAFLCCFHALPAHASTGLSITEIMYDPAGTDDKREWVEVYNSGTSDIDMTGHYILTDGIGSSKHSLVAQQSSSVIPAGSYAVIVQDPGGFRGDYPSYTGLMFDSSWTGLTATSGKTIVIVDSQSNVLDSVTYDPTVGGDNTGDSLQKNSAGVWVAVAPSPGAATSDSAVSVVVAAQSSSGGTDATSSTADSSDDDSDASSSSTADGLAAGGTPTVVPQASLSANAVYAELHVPAHATVGIPVTVSDTVYDSSGAHLVFGASHFALGDGSAQDGMAENSFLHSYMYPGTYVVTFEYKKDPYMPDTDATARATIEVSEPSVAISNVTTDGSIELSNTGTREADISNWALAPGGALSASTAFHVPPGTIVLPGKKITFAAAVTGLSPSDAELSALVLPTGALASHSASQIATTAVASPAPVTASTQDPAPPKMSAKPKSQVASGSVSDPLAPTVALAANAIAAIPDTGEPAPSKGHSMLPFVVGIVIILGASIAALYKFDIFKAPKPLEGDSAAPEKAEDTDANEIRILEE